MPNKKWTDIEVTEIEIMKKTMTVKQIAEKKGLRIAQVNYALHSYLMKEQGTIKSMSEQPKKFWQWLIGAK